MSTASLLIFQCVQLNAPQSKSGGLLKWLHTEFPLWPLNKKNHPGKSELCQLATCCATVEAVSLETPPVGTDIKCLIRKRLWSWDGRRNKEEGKAPNTTSSLRVEPLLSPAIGLKRRGRQQRLTFCWRNDSPGEAWDKGTKHTSPLLNHPSSVSSYI